MSSMLSETSALTLLTRLIAFAFLNLFFITGTASTPLVATSLLARFEDVVT
jgi:hypothetical protein